MGGVVSTPATDLKSVAPLYIDPRVRGRLLVLCSVRHPAGKCREFAVVFPWLVRHRGRGLAPLSLSSGTAEL